MATTEGESLMMHEIYNFYGYAGVANCDQCDNDTMVNEYNRSDGLVVALCEKCEDRLGL
jgi:hypothetical protein